MNDSQKAEIEAIGGQDLLDQIIAAAGTRKAELEQNAVERKSTDEQVPTKDTQVPTEDESQEKLVHAVAEEVVQLLAAKVPTGDKADDTAKTPDAEEKTPETKSLAAQVADELQLTNLSKALEFIAVQQKDFATQLAALQQADDTKIAAKVEAAPRFSWYRASQADSTVLTDGDALKTAAPEPPVAVQGIIAAISEGS